MRSPSGSHNQSDLNLASLKPTFSALPDTRRPLIRSAFRTARMIAGGGVRRGGPRFQIRLLGRHLGCDHHAAVTSRQFAIRSLPALQHHREVGTACRAIVAKARPGPIWATSQIHSPGEIKHYSPDAKMRIKEDEVFRLGPATALMDGAVPMRVGLRGDPPTGLGGRLMPPGEELTGDRSLRREECGGRAFEDDRAALVAGAGAEVDDPVRA
jgi:hypothetical protein